MSERDWTVENTEWPVWMKGLDGEQYSQQREVQCGPADLEDDPRIKELTDKLMADPRVIAVMADHMLKQMQADTRCCGDSGDCICGK